MLVVDDGPPGKPNLRAFKAYDGLGDIAFSPDGRRLGITVQSFAGGATRPADAGEAGPGGPRPPAQWQAVIDGKEGPVYDGISQLLFSADSRHVAYVAGRQGRQVLVVDGADGPLLDGVGVFVFSPDGSRFAYAAQQGQDRWLMVDHKPCAPAGLFAFSPDGRHICHAVSRGEKWALAIDNVTAGGDYAASPRRPDRVRHATRPRHRRPGTASVPGGPEDRAVTQSAGNAVGRRAADRPLQPCLIPALHRRPHFPPRVHDVLPDARQDPLGGPRFVRGTCRATGDRNPAHSHPRRPAPPGHVPHRGQSAQVGLVHGTHDQVKGAAIVAGGRDVGQPAHPPDGVAGPFQQPGQGRPGVLVTPDKQFAAHSCEPQGPHGRGSLIARGWCPGAFGKTCPERPPNVPAIGPRRPIAQIAGAAQLFVDRRYSPTVDYPVRGPETTEFSLLSPFAFPDRPPGSLGRPRPPGFRGSRHDGPCHGH